MAYQSLGIGSAADDGTGDSLRVGGDKINDNFSEIYTLLGTMEFEWFLIVIHQLMKVACTH